MINLKWTVIFSIMFKTKTAVSCNIKATCLGKQDQNNNYYNNKISSYSNIIMLENAIFHQLTFC